MNSGRSDLRGSGMDTVPSGTCGAVVDASDHTRSVHRPWHASRSGVIGSTAPAREPSLNIA